MKVIIKMEKLGFLINFMLPQEVVQGPLAAHLPIFSLLSLSRANKHYWIELMDHPKLQSWKALFLSTRWVCCLARAIEEGDEEVFRFCERKGVFCDVKDHSMAARAIG